MAEKIEKKQDKKSDKQRTAEKEKSDKAEKKKTASDEENEVLVRVMGYDIPGSKNILTGLIRIKGVSWAISNATCLKLKIPKSKKISDLTKADIDKIEHFFKNMDILNFLKNRRFDFESGETAHYFGSDLEIKKEFDIKRLKEIRSYRGLRHASRQPVRGQRTRSHFRTKGRAMGVKRKKKE